MKYNVHYRKLSLAPVHADPSPMTREGAYALTERFYALNPAIGLRAQVGGAPPSPGIALTSPTILPTKKTKRSFR